MTSSQSNPQMMSQMTQQKKTGQGQNNILQENKSIINNINNGQQSSKYIQNPKQYTAGNISQVNPSGISSSKLNQNPKQNIQGNLSQKQSQILKKNYEGIPGTGSLHINNNNIINQNNNEINRENQLLQNNNGLLSSKINNSNPYKLNNLSLIDSYTKHSNINNLNSGETLKYVQNLGINNQGNNNNYQNHSNINNEINDNLIKSQKKEYMNKNISQGNSNYNQNNYINNNNQKINGSINSKNSDFFLLSHESQIKNQQKKDNNIKSGPNNIEVEYGLNFNQNFNQNNRQSGIQNNNFLNKNDYVPPEGKSAGNNKDQAEQNNIPNYNNNQMLNNNNDFNNHQSNLNNQNNQIKYDQNNPVNNFSNNFSNANNNNIINNMNNQNNNMLIDNNNNQNMQNPPYSFSIYKKAPLTGLKSKDLQADISYFYAVLQLLGSIRNIASYFVNPKNKEVIERDIGSNPLAFTFHRLFLHLYPYPEPHQKREIYNPHTLLELLGELNVVYKTNKKRNPNDLLVFILNYLHNELKTFNKNNYKSSYPNYNDKNNVIQCQIYNMQFNSTIISNNLNWFEIKDIQCTKCGNILYQCNSYNIFELDINITYKINKKQITIYDCLKIYEFPKNQTLFCQNCRNYNNYIIRSKIFSSPNSFIFSLDRRDLDQNLIKIPFLIEDTINIKNYIENKDVPSKYQLTGIVSFNINYNKYISYCVSPVDKQWYEYNDEKCTLTNLQNVVSINNNNKSAIPCILIYKSISE